MKKIVLFVFTLVSGVMFAQRSNDALAIHAKAGIMKGKGELIKDVAGSANLGLQWFAGQKGFFIEGGFLLQDFQIKHEELNIDIPYTMYGVNVMGGWSFEDLNPLFLNAKIGGFAGYYIANKGEEKEAVYGTNLPEVKGITYGALASAEAEIVIWRRLSGVASFSQYFYPNDKWIRWNYAIEAGFKFYL